MRRKVEDTPEALEGEIETAANGADLEAEGDAVDMTSEASLPDPEEPAVAEPSGEAPESDGGASGKAAAAPVAEAKEPVTRRYRPTEDYAEGDRIHHPIWNATGVVTYRDPRERIFRIPVGLVEERGRCHLIRVAFDSEVPASGGPRREVTLVADWRGKPFEVGAPQPPPAPEPEPFLGLPPVEEPRAAAARSRKPVLPDIPEPDEAPDLGDEVEDLEPVEQAEEEDSEAPLV